MQIQSKLHANNLRKNKSFILKDLFVDLSAGEFLDVNFFYKELFLIFCYFNNFSQDAEDISAPNFLYLVFLIAAA